LSVSAGTEQESNRRSSKNLCVLIGDGSGLGCDVEVLKVSSKSNPNLVAGALAGVIRHAGAVEVQVVGAGALNQAVKAVAIARGYVAPSGVDLVCIPTFADIEIEGQSRTAIRLLVECRPAEPGRPAHPPERPSLAVVPES
jgi:stage V sporulation protein S